MKNIDMELLLLKGEEFVKRFKNDFENVLPKMLEDDVILKTPDDLTKNMLLMESANPSYVIRAILDYLRNSILDEEFRYRIILEMKEMVKKYG